MQQKGNSSESSFSSERLSENVGPKNNLILIGRVMNLKFTFSFTFVSSWYVSTPPSWRYEISKVYLVWENLFNIFWEQIMRACDYNNVTKVNCLKEYVPGKIPSWTYLKSIKWKWHNSMTSLIQDLKKHSEKEEEKNTSFKLAEC